MLLLFLSLYAAEALRLRTSGIDSVITVLKDMLTNFNAQSVDDKTNWESYSTWSDSEETDRNAFIQEQEGLVMSATAALNSNKQQVQTLTGQITDLTGEIAATEASLHELLTLRAEEHQEHEADLTDLTHTIEAVNKATEVLEGHYAASGAEGLAQIKQEVTKALSTLALRNSFNGQTNTAVASLLQQPDWLNADGAAAYGSYDSPNAAGGGVVETLKSIRSTLLESKQSSIEKENEARRQFEMAKEAKEQDLQRSKTEKTEKENTLEECTAKIEHFTATINQAQADIKDAQDYVALLQSDRAKFGQQYDERVAMRNQENAATQAALDALQEVTAGAKGGVEGAFLEESVHRGILCPKCKPAVERLLRLGASTHSAELVQVGVTIRSKMSQDPTAYFDPKAMEPVRNLLHSLIGKLEEELAAETSHHEWCATEKETSQAAKAERETNIAALEAEIGELTTRISQLTSEIAFLQSELVRVQQETNEAISIRKDEHATFVKAKADHDQVISALDKALAALSGQYGSFMQVKAKGSTPFAEYSSGGGAGSSAISMLQDLLNKYSAARTELVQAEGNAQSAHEDLLAHNEQFRKDTAQTKQAKETEKRQASERLTNARAELAANRQQLAEVNTYIADLRPSCDDIRMTFEERKKRREAEIAALKETLAVLEDPTTYR